MALAPDGTEAQTDVLALLAELPGGQREAIRLVKLEGWSVLEASQMTGQSEAAVKVNIHRGLRRLSAICQEGSR
jgi:RNA polymerase sigma-70 factor (ECF subfamily)